MTSFFSCVNAIVMNPGSQFSDAGHFLTIVALGSRIIDLIHQWALSE